MKSPTLTRRSIGLMLALALLSNLTADEIDWDLAKALRQKSRSGQTLNQEESAYLEKAMQARTRPSSPNPMRGDGIGETPTVAAVEVSEVDSPVKMLTATASDGNRIEVPYRVPIADHPLPAIVFIHGSLGQRKPRELVENITSNPTQTRFLAAGYVTVAATFRTYVDTPLSRGPILDVAAIIQEVQKLPEVDPESVVVFGTSGGGSIALELAAQAELSLPAVVIGEPATVLYTGLMTDLSMRDRSMKEYATLYTDERRKATEAKIAAISSPLLVHHGDVHPLRKINFEVVFPAIQKAEKSITVKHYPGENHGFYWGNRTSEETVNSVVSSTLEFISPFLNSPPAKR